MKLNTRVAVEGNKVTLLFNEGDVFYNDRYWGRIDAILGFEYTVSENGSVDTMIMVRDYDTKRFPDGIRRHSTTEKIEDFDIRGCDTDQEKYEALVTAGHNMRLISMAYRKVEFWKLGKRAKFMLDELRELITERTCHKCERFYEGFVCGYELEYPNMDKKSMVQLRDCRHDSCIKYAL